MCEIVSFEIAKKLKEKGFDYPCFDAINSFGCTYRNGWCEYLDDRCNELITLADLHKGDCLLPTISQVLKYLRETHNIYIVVFINDDTDKPVTFEIYKGTECVMCEHSYYSLAEWNKAEMDAIEYVIDNLI